MSAPKPARVLVSDKLAASAVKFLQESEGIEVDVKTGLSPEELVRVIGGYHGLIIRSGTTVTADILNAAGQLLVVGRAGIGVDNVDLAVATARGVLVMNTPTANATTTAEHAIALMFALARRVPQATASMKAGKWEKSKFSGRQLTGLTLGVVGAGKIGSLVASRGIGLKMKVLACDPYLSEERARRLGVERVELDALLARSDFVTLHTPLTDSTRGLFGTETLAKMKAGAYLVCAARGGIVDEVALQAALESGHLGGAALDVFASEPPASDHPLFALSNFICTPHLGASTAEAQEAVSTEIAAQVVDFLRDGEIRNAVNAPVPNAEERSAITPWAELAEKLGSLAAQLWPESSRDVTVEVFGEVAELDLRPVTASMLVGLLSTHLDSRVNVVNAALIARERGLKITESRSTGSTDFSNQVNLRCNGDGVTHVLSATVLSEGGPRVVRLDNIAVESLLEGYILFIRNEDRPGVVGRIGTLLGERQINVARLQVGADAASGTAVALWSTDLPVSADDLAEIRRIPDVVSAIQVKL